MRCWAIRQVHQQHAIDSFAILIEDNHVSEVPVTCVLADLLERETLSTAWSFKVMAFGPGMLSQEWHEQNGSYIGFPLQAQVRLMKHVV